MSQMQGRAHAKKTCTGSLQRVFALDQKMRNNHVTSYYWLFLGGYKNRSWFGGHWP